MHFFGQLFRPPTHPDTGESEQGWGFCGLPGHSAVDGIVDGAKQRTAHNAAHNLVGRPEIHRLPSPGGGSFFMVC